MIVIYPWYNSYAIYKTKSPAGAERTSTMTDMMQAIDVQTFSKGSLNKLNAIFEQSGVFRISFGTMLDNLDWAKKVQDVFRFPLSATLAVSNPRVEVESC